MAEKTLPPIDSRAIAAMPWYRRNLYLSKATDAERAEVDALVRAESIRLAKKADAIKAGSVVYFIQSGEDGPIKIGTSSNFSSRLASLRTSQPHEIAVLAVVSGGRSLERSYHKKFADMRVVGEWFDPQEPILAEIDRLNGHLAISHTVSAPFSAESGEGV